MDVGDKFLTLNGDVFTIYVKGWLVNLAYGVSSNLNDLGSHVFDKEGNHVSQGIDIAEFRGISVEKIANRNFNLIKALPNQGTAGIRKTE